MDEPTATPPAPQPNVEVNISNAQLEKLKEQIIENCKAYAGKGAKTRKEPIVTSEDKTGGYDYWDNEATYEKDNWSVHYWKYDDGRWTIQITRIELKLDGHSNMISYSIRPNDDKSFPGLQVYEEQKDKTYRKAGAEDVVYLGRVTEGLQAVAPATN